MKNKIVQLTIGSVLLITLAFVGALGSCNAIADTSGLNLTPETVWIRLVPSVAVEGTATLVLDFSKPISGLTVDTPAADLVKLFTFNNVDGTFGAEKITPVRIMKESGAVYTLAVENVPADAGLVLVTINKSGIAPATRYWSLDGAHYSLTLSEADEGGISATVDGVPLASNPVDVAAGKTVVFTVPAVSGKKGSYTLVKTEGGEADVSVTPMDSASPSYLYELSGGGAAPINILGYEGGVVERSLLRLNDLNAGETLSWSFVMPAYDVTVSAQFTEQAAEELAGRSFEIRLDASETVSPQALGTAYINYLSDGVQYQPNIKGAQESPVSITILARDPASGGRCYVDLAAPGYLFYLADGANITLTIGKNIALRGLTAVTNRAADAPAGTYSGIDQDNQVPIVRIQGGNTLVLAENAAISGNWSNHSAGAVDLDGTFNMSGANTAIHHNYAFYGAVQVHGTFTMSGTNAEIYGNVCSGIDRYVGIVNISGGTVFGTAGTAYPEGTVSAGKANTGGSLSASGPAGSGVKFLKNGYVGMTAKSVNDTQGPTNDTLYIPPQ
ncbi:MAG: hypothetical protein LBT01_09155 [Spirochaetaceae bacterium]|jgi:hypothetical protein|nr:hypothetical protein [Spirochaetaceae bacterium]